MRPLSTAARARQHGFFLLLIVLSLLAIGGTVFLTGLAGGKAAERLISQGAAADQRLLFARDALLGYAIGNIADVSGRPGQLPAPDTLQDGNYDGNTNNTRCLDGTAVNGLPALSGGNPNLRCLGRLPWKTLGLQLDIDTVNMRDEFDALGQVPWYAVSANLSATNACLTYINPGTVAAAPVSYACPSDIAPPFPWLKVCDQTGRLLSDKVAFVVIAPGAPIDTVGRTQARNGVPRPQPADFLDAIPVPAGWGALPVAQRCTTYDNAALSNEFVMADATSGFNDRLLYVTIDELMARVENRVAQQVREALIAYEGAYGRYPWLVPIGNPSSVPDGFVAVTNTRDGLLPFHTQYPAQRFRTEVNWTIGTTGASDTVSPAGSSSPVFLCFGGTYQCRLRTSPGNVAIPRTVTAAQFLALKTSAIGTPDFRCSYTTMSRLDCDTYTYTQTQFVTYDVQRRTPPGSGTYSTYNTYSGVQSRTITLLFSGILASNPVFSTDGAQFMRRSLTTASTSTIGLLSAVDSWSPSSGAGSAPFDIASSFQTGSAATSGSGVVTASNIRVYPELPQWYGAHKWNEFIYAAISPDASPAVGGHTCTTNCFSAGARIDLNAVVISAGKMIGMQDRYTPVPSTADFIEAPNRTGVSTRIFADPNVKQDSTYADTVVTIPR